MTGGQPLVHRTGSAVHTAAADLLTLEAHLLDERRFDEWIELFDPAITYSMPVRLSLMPKDGPGFREDMDYYLDDYVSLRARVDRLKTGQAWAEQPGSRTRHLYTNALVTDAGSGGLSVKCQFLVTRSRADRPADLFSGARRDVLVPYGDTWRVRKRTILLDQTVLKSFNLSIFF